MVEIGADGVGVGGSGGGSAGKGEETIVEGEALCGCSGGDSVGLGAGTTTGGGAASVMVGVVKLLVGVAKVLAVMELAVQAAVGARLAGGVARMTSLSSGWTRSLSSRAVPLQRGLGCSQSKSVC